MLLLLAFQLGHSVTTSTSVVTTRSGVQRQRLAQRQRDGLFDIEEDDENVIRLVIAKFMEVHE